MLNFLLFGLITTANYFSPNLSETETLSISSQSYQKNLHDGSNAQNSLIFDEPYVVKFLNASLYVQVTYGLQQTDSLQKN